MTDARAPGSNAAPPWLATVRAGYASLQQGGVLQAERAARDVLTRWPAQPAGLNLLAIALTAQGRNAEAAPLFEQLTRLEPSVGAHWTNWGTALRAEGQLTRALDAYVRAAALGEKSASFHYNVGLLHLDRGDFDSARCVLAIGHRLAPQDAEIAYHYALACHESMHSIEGAAALSSWQRLQGLTTELTAKIGIMLMNLGDPDASAVAIARARQDPNPDAAARLQLALALERTNRIGEARAELKALERLPAGVRAAVDVRVAKAKLAQREGLHEEAIAIYRELVESCPDEERKHYHLFPLAKSLDALRRYDEAFAALEHAHSSQHHFMRLTSPDMVARKREPMRITRHGCDPADVEKWDHADAPAAAHSPIFIVAYPRSGTTLLEQTLDAHPLLRTMDEQPFIQAALEQFAAPDVLYPERLATLTRAQLAHAREHYWNLVARRVQLEPGQRLLDKNPLNILRLPAIQRLFPHSPIVLAIRHPCDVLLSCYMQHFRADFAWICRDLDTLAIAYRRSFDFWYQQAELLQPRVREIRYERFVAAFEEHVRGLAEFLELPWHDDLLSPGRRALDRGFISTPSYAQVVEPVHTRSIDRWRAYESHFVSALTHVRPYLERWGYRG
jgi:tetratricopeptide (TPR) repeat protein